MDKHLKKRKIITKICVLLLIFIYVLPVFFTVVFGKEPRDVGYNEWNDIPEPYGDQFTYMGWQLITDRTSEDWQLIEAAKVDYYKDENFDSEGYGVIDGCYVIACTHNRLTTGGIAVIGDYIDFQLDNGVIINCIMGDEKASGDAGWTVWGHNGGRCVVEFVVDERTWYTNGQGSHANPGQGNGQLDKVLKGRRVVKYIRKGNYIKGARLGGTVATQNPSSSSGGGADLTNFGAAVKAIFGGIWDAVSVEFENLVYQGDDITTRYDLNDKDDQSTKSNSGNLQNNSGRTRNGVVQYYQDDYGHVKYGSATLAQNGCGPTALAMAVSTVTGKTVTPEDIINWCGEKYHTVGGTTWDIFPAAATHYNINCKETGSIDDAVSALKEGKVVISSQSAGLFTRNGHFIVLTAVDSEDRISVNDPNKKNALNKQHNGDTGYDNTTFTKDEINASAKKYWIFW